MTRRRLVWKSFVSFLMLFAFAGLAITGLVLYVAPAGRVSNWSQWTLLALQKEQWQGVHTLLSATFFVTGAIHLILNWPVLRAYLRMKMATGRPRRRELVAATVTVAAVTAIAVFDLPPAQQVMDLGETIKASWSDDGNEPPVPHAELLSIGRLAELRQVPAATLVSNLRKAGFNATTDTTLAQAAAERSTSPSAAYKSMIGALEPGSPQALPSGGYGRRTVRELAAQLNVASDVALQRLRAKGIAAGADSNVREVAIAHGKLPTDLAAIVAAR